MMSGVYRFPQMENIVFGTPYVDVLAHEVDRLEARAVFVLASGTLARTTAVTGVEMEALVAASVAALTIYDMCKALDKGIEIREVFLVRKSGGKSGDYRRRKSS